MNKYKVDKYGLQSYFKSLCNSFYIAYRQVKRLEKEQEELKAANMVNLADYLRIRKEKAFWKQKLKKMNREIVDSIGSSIIVSTKEEIIALLAFFHDHPAAENQIINTSEEALRSFPTGEKMYEEFLAAYNADAESIMIGIYGLREPAMEKVYKTYF